MAKIKIKNIKVSFGDNFLFEARDLMLGSGIYPMLGPNGCGKSTLLKVLSGYIKAEKNDFHIDEKIFYSPQHSYIFEGDLISNITIASDDFDISKINEAIKLFSLDKVTNKSPKDFSGGEKQKLLILRAIFSGKNILFLDEPLSSIDKDSSEEIIFFIKNYLKEKNKILLIPIHNIKYANELSNNHLVFKNKSVFLEKK